MKKFAAAFALVAAGALATPALAESYRIDSNSTRQIPIDACGDFHLSAVGDHDTDLDFRMIDSAGRTVFVDNDSTDMTFQDITMTKCERLTLYVQNLGDVYNTLDLRMTYKN